MKKKESTKEKKVRGRQIVSKLRRAYPNARTALRYHDAFQLLVATILSAQCTDARVNIVTPGLFKKYPTAKHFAAATPSELETEIRSTGFFRNKTRSIIAAAKSVVDQFHGEVPRTMEELLTLGGVGRKTANCVLGGAFGTNEGIVVDTHVLRLSKRLGLSGQKDPVKVEGDLMEIVPKNEWYSFSNYMINHGRAVCDARNPRCPDCVLRNLCPSAEGFIRNVRKRS